MQNDYLISALVSDDHEETTMSSLNPILNESTNTIVQLLLDHDLRCILSVQRECQLCSQKATTRVESRQACRDICRHPFVETKSVAVLS